jgi:hypothetical protein
MERMGTGEVRTQHATASGPVTCLGKSGYMRTPPHSIISVLSLAAFCHNGRGRQSYRDGMTTGLNIYFLDLYQKRLPTPILCQRQEEEIDRIWRKLWGSQQVRSLPLNLRYMNVRLERVSEFIGPHL